MAKSFSTYLRPRESLITVFFAHPAAFTLSLTLSIVFLSGSVFFFLPLVRRGTPGVVGLGLLFFLGTLLLLRVSTLRRNNAALITDERIIYVKRTGVLEEEVAEVPLDLIADIRFKRKGPWQMSFNFGTVTIKSQGAEPVSIENIPQPRRIQELLFELQAQLTKKDKEKQDILVNEFLSLAKSMKYRSQLNDEEKN